MHYYHIDQMVAALIDARLIPENKQAKAKAVLSSCWKKKIAITWGVEDIQSVVFDLQQATEDSDDDSEVNPCKNFDKRFNQDESLVSEDEAESILQNILEHHDSELGVSWNTVRDYVKDYLAEANSDL